MASTSFEDSASNMQSLNQSVYTSPNHHGSGAASATTTTSTPNNQPGFLSGAGQQNNNSSLSNGMLGSAFNSVTVGSASCAQSAMGMTSTPGIGGTATSSRSNSNTRASSPTTSVDMHDSSMDEGMNSSSSAMMNEVRDKLKADKKDKQSTKKLIKEMAPCKSMLQEMEVSSCWKGN